MRNRQTLATWIIIFLILIGSAVLTIFLPALLGDGGTGGALPRDPSTVTIPLPLPILDRNELVVPSVYLMISLFLVVVGAVVGLGITLFLVALILSKLVNNTTSSTDYQRNAAALEKRRTEKINAMRATRPTGATPESTWKRASVITTAITILMFVAFLALLAVGALFPSRQIADQQTIVNVGSLVVAVSLVITIIILAFTLRADRLAAIDSTDTLSIPWDFIVVLLTGLLVVGLGVGLISVLNAGPG